MSDLRMDVKSLLETQEKNIRENLGERIDKLQIIVGGIISVFEHVKFDCSPKEAHAIITQLREVLERKAKIS